MANPYLPCLTRTTLAIVVGIAAPLAADDSVAEFLEAADMTFSLEEADKMTVYDVTTANGYTFKLTETEDGYTFGLDESPTMPQSGNWSRVVEPTRSDCEDLNAADFVSYAFSSPLINRFLGSTDGGATAPYEFTAPFGAEQLLGPIFEVMEMAEFSSDVTYGTDGGAMHSVQGQMTDASDFSLNFKMEFHAGRCLIMGDWYGVDADHPDCQAWGLVTWQREGAGCDL